MPERHTLEGDHPRTAPPLRLRDRTAGTSCAGVMIVLSYPADRIPKFAAICCAEDVPLIVPLRRVLHTRYERRAQRRVRCRKRRTIKAARRNSSCLTDGAPCPCGTTSGQGCDPSRENATSLPRRRIRFEQSSHRRKLK